MRRIVLFSILMSLMVTSLFAGGYQVRLQGHRQTGMGLVGTSIFGDASNAFYNPAGLSLMKTKYSILVGGSGIFSTTAFALENSVYQATTDNPMGTPFFVYGAGKIGEKLGVGIGVYTPYGSSAKWGDDWAGAHLIQDISMKVIFIQPTVSYKINDLISLGAGFVYATGDVQLHKEVTFNSAEEKGQATLEGKTTNFGFNAGVMVTPNDKWSIGVDYRSEVTMALEDGDATFKVPSSVSGLIPEKNKFDADLPLPANLDFGVAYQATEKLLVSAEVNYVFWDTYDTLKFTFETDPTGQLSKGNPRLYSNKMIFRVGGEYVFSEKFTLRAGAYYDPTPTNKDYFNPETPSLNTYGMSFGFSYNPTKNLAIDFSYLHLETQKSTRSYSPEYFTGTYKVRTLIPGIGISYNF
jgi:long-chain fatty acid transport protein